MLPSIKTLLNKDPVANMAAIGYFKNYPLESFHVSGESAILSGTSDFPWYHIIAKDDNELKHLLNSVAPVPSRFFSIEDWMIPVIETFGERDWLMNTHRYILYPEKPVPDPSIDTNSLDVSFSDYIFNNSDYKEYLTVDYIEDRLKKDISAGIFENGTLIAWGFTHDDGALGFLHVLESHRKKGLGKDIVLSLIHKRRQSGDPVFCNIVPENTPSINLVTSLGFQFDRSVSWLKLK